MLAKGQHSHKWRVEDMFPGRRVKRGHEFCPPASTRLLMSDLVTESDLSLSLCLEYLHPSIWQPLLSNILWFQPCKWLLEHAKGQKVGLGHTHWLTQHTIRQPQLPEQPSAMRGHKIYPVCIENKVKCLQRKLLRRWGPFLAPSFGAC